MDRSSKLKYRKTNQSCIKPNKFAVCRIFTILVSFECSSKPHFNENDIVANGKVLDIVANAMKMILSVRPPKKRRRI